VARFLDKSRSAKRVFILKILVATSSGLNDSISTGN